MGVNVAVCATAIDDIPDSGCSYLRLLVAAAFQQQLPAPAGCRVSLIGFAGTAMAMGINRQGAERRKV